MCRQWLQLHTEPWTTRWETQLLKRANSGKIMKRITTYSNGGM